MRKYLLFISILVVFVSCKVQKQVLFASKVANQEISKSNKKLSAKAKSEFELDNIDPFIQAALIEKIDALEKRIDSRLQLIENKAAKMRKAKAESLLDSLQQEMDEDNASILAMNQSLDIKSFYEFPASSFFGPGVYKLSEDKITATQNTYLPIIDSLSKFSNLFPEQKLELYLVTYGYADGQGFSEGSDLYKELALALKKESPARQEMNQKLSDYRANTMAEFLKEFLSKSKEKFKAYDNLRQASFAIGKGEELPSKKIVDYQDDDARRRIVKFYWKILPSIK